MTEDEGRKVVVMIAQGATNRAIARCVGVSEATIALWIRLSGLQKRIPFARRVDRALIAMIGSGNLLIVTQTHSTRTPYRRLLGRSVRWGIAVGAFCGVSYIITATIVGVHLSNVPTEVGLTLLGIVVAGLVGAFVGSGAAAIAVVVAAFGLHAETKIGILRQALGSLAASLFCAAVISGPSLVSAEDEVPVVLASICAVVAFIVAWVYLFCSRNVFAEK
jgi:hypothetical protein